jgi:hypothetical protein
MLLPVGSRKFFCVSFPLEHQFVVLRADLDFIARLEFARPQLWHERVEQMFLDRALGRAGTELRVMAFAGEQLLCARGHIVQHEVLLRETCSVKNTGTIQDGSVTRIRRIGENHGASDIRQHDERIPDYFHRWF